MHGYARCHAHGRAEADLERYQVNLVNDPTNGAPIIYEANPTIDRLTGEVEHQAQMGALVTDFTMIKPGGLHRANGGYLILEAMPLLMRPYAWEALKRALKERGSAQRKLLSDQMRFISTVSLEPEPIPLNLSVALIGSPMIYYLLTYYDEDFGKLFIVQADFSSDIDRSNSSMLQYAQFIAHVPPRGATPFHPRGCGAVGGAWRGTRQVLN